ncbi:hypothetical protein BHU72_00945 [Desulfuribacillus stibiiarsenatis]|uniref:NodB homology domain-containing protein n=1 Tax=Desulfuribacillus stibiiarsenatis TaxID=1390249 RepID=A0A1E5LA33_9FIRM|nr:stalk domain-containing protein [Desulfuribacillus stibiiarsenatis]OEH86863.1 hypothetical protein BHU72_00945 [Desulfuribacillus stibiiarsenatis]
MTNRLNIQLRFYLLAAFIMTIILIVSVTTTEANTNRDIRVFVDGKSVQFPDVKPYIDVNNRTLVPLRAAGEAAGASVEWNGYLNQVTLMKGNRTVVLTANSSIYTVNGQALMMDTSMVYNKPLGRNYVPLRFVMEGLGAEIEWQMVDKTDVIYAFTLYQSQDLKQSMKIDINHAVKKENLLNNKSFQDFRKMLISLPSHLGSGSNVLSYVQYYLQVPSDFYKNTSIEYFKNQPVYTQKMDNDLIEYLARFEYADKVSVLTYHHLLKASENTKFQNNSAVISVESFEEQMKVLHENRYQAYDLAVLEDYVKGKIKLPKHSVFITFDDGYLSNYVYAYPILKAYDYKATIFVVTGMLNSYPDSFNADKLNFISWQELDKHRDVFRIEGHTHDLHKLTNNVSHLVSQPSEIVRNDLLLSRQLIDGKYFAYPYGQVDATVINLLKQTGYTMAFTNRLGTVSPGNDIYVLKRYGIYPNTSVYDFKGYVGIPQW